MDNDPQRTEAPATRANFIALAEAHLSLAARYEVLVLCVGFLLKGSPAALEALRDTVPKIPELDWEEKLTEDQRAEAMGVASHIVQCVQASNDADETDMPGFGAVSTMVH